MLETQSLDITDSDKQTRNDMQWQEDDGYQCWCQIISGHCHQPGHMHPELKLCMALKEAQGVLMCDFNLLATYLQKIINKSVFKQKQSSYAICNLRAFEVQQQNIANFDKFGA